MKQWFEHSYISLLENILPSDNSHLQRRKRKYKMKLQRNCLKEKILSYYDGCSDTEILEVLSYLKSNPVDMIPYEFKKKYSPANIEVNFDKEAGYSYVWIGAHKVFFPAGMKTREIQTRVMVALMEQDPDSPHRYLTSEFNIDDGIGSATLIGASDGIFALSIIDKVDMLFLFEADEQWTGPLQQTFSSFRHKIEIVNKYVSNHNSDRTITLDSFFLGREEALGYIQVDVEGMESQVLEGTQRILSQSEKLIISLCCYHKEEDETYLARILQNYGFTTRLSHGYLICDWELLNEPYLRRGVIYASKP